MLNVRTASIFPGGCMDIFASYLQTIVEIGLFQILFKMLMTLVSSEEVKDKSHPVLLLHNYHRSVPS